MKKILSFGIFAVLAMGFSSCQMLSNFKVDQNRANQAMAIATQYLTVSDSQVQLASKQSITRMDAQAKIAPATNAYTQRLNRLTSDLATADGIPLNFKVYLTNDVNAFATPDGSIRVYSGLMDMTTDDELLGIIGHELGHVALHHSREAMRNAILVSAARQGLASLNSTIASLSDSFLGDIGEAYFNSKYSRSQENQADGFGYDFLVMQKRNPWAMVSSFEKFAKLEQSNSASTGGNLSAAQMFSSHPETKERIANISKRCQDDGYTRPASK